MGAANSNLTRCIEDEFQRLVKQGRNYLVLEEVLALRLPPSSWAVDPSHLGVLFTVDSNHDGRFTLEELLSFVDLARQRSRCYQPYEFQAQMQGFCTLQLWKTTSLGGGSAKFVDWMSRLLMENMPTRRFAHCPEEVYLNRDTIETLYHLLSVKETQGMDFQRFLDLLQRVGEENGSMELGSEELDDWLPLTVVRDFIASLNSGMLKVMADTYPAHELAEVQL
ncbi:g11604 [Coccomyxa elongata]